MIPKHKVFLSFHSEDLEWKNKFEALFAGATETIVSKSVQTNDIPEGLNTETVRQIIRDKYLRESTVTIVLIGPKTWQRKHVDWEISSSIRHTGFNRRSGLIGIFLPNFPFHFGEYRFHVPPRLMDNVDKGFAKLHNWTENPQKIKELIHEAFMQKDKINPDNSRDLYGKNSTKDNWSR